ncbi:MAG: thioredoxin [Endomicrobiales bacterium]|nr:thioredoxin [Endomicrobiales bacterium]
MKVKVLNSSNFKQEVLDANETVLVDFYADWCGPCRLVAPVIEDLAEKYAGKVKMCKLNVDDSGDVAMKYGIQSIPTVLLFKNGQQVDGFLGAQPRPSIERFIDKNIN